MTRTRTTRVEQVLDGIPRLLFAGSDPAPSGRRERSSPSASAGHREPSSPLSTGHRERSSPTASDVETVMLEALELEGGERVLCVGWGIGHELAVLSRLAGEVFAVELDAALEEREARVLAELKCENVHYVRSGDALGFRERAPYAAILVKAAAPELPDAFVQQLSPGGRLVIALGDAEAQLVQRLDKRADGVSTATLGAGHFRPLPEIDPTPSSFPWTHHRH